MSPVCNTQYNFRFLWDWVLTLGKSDLPLYCMFKKNLSKWLLLQILVFLYSWTETCLYTAAMFLMSVCTFQLAGVDPEFLSVFYCFLTTDLNKTFLPSMACSNIFWTSIKYHCVFNESVNLNVSCCGLERQFLSRYLRMLVEKE